MACVGLVLVMLARENKRVQAKGRWQGCDKSPFCFKKFSTSIFYSNASKF